MSHHPVNPTIRFSRAGKQFVAHKPAQVPEALNSKEVLPTDHYWMAGMGDWKRVSELIPLLPNLIAASASHHRHAAPQAEASPEPAGVPVEAPAAVAPKVEAAPLPVAPAVVEPAPRPVAPVAPPQPVAAPVAPVVAAARVHVAPVAVQPAEPSLIATTTQSVEGCRVLRYLGLVRGVTLRSAAGLESCEKSRAEAYDAMLRNARALGANAIIGIAYESGPAGSSTEVLCYGTAVVIEPVAWPR